MHACMYVCMHACGMHVCMYVCMYACEYVCIEIYTHTDYMKCAHIAAGSRVIVWVCSHGNGVEMLVQRPQPRRRGRIFCRGRWTGRDASAAVSLHCAILCAALCAPSFAVPRGAGVHVPAGLAAQHHRRRGLHRGGGPWPSGESRRGGGGGEVAVLLKQAVKPCPLL